MSRALRVSDAPINPVQSSQLLISNTTTWKFLQALKKPVVFMPDRLLPLELEGVEHLTFLRIAGCSAESLLVNFDGQVTALSQAPMVCLGIVHDEADDAPLMSAVAQWLRARGMQAIPQTVCWQTAGIAHALRRLLTAALDWGHRNSLYANTANKSLAVLRQHHEDLQNRAELLEGALSADNRQPFRTVFSELPQPNQSTVTSSAFRQVLPVASRGVSAIGLHVVDEAKDGYCVVRLRSIEDNVTHARWVIAARHLKTGPHILGLRRGIKGFKRTLELTVSPRDAASALPTFALGSHQPIPLFRVQNLDQEEQSDRSLALKIWAGIPGVPPPDHFFHWPEDQGDRLGRFETFLPDVRALALVKTADTGGEEFRDFDAVSHSQVDHTILCHPPWRSSTVAELKSFVPARAIRVSADILLDHPRSRPVAFALACADSRESVLGFLKGNQRSDSVEWTGWSVLNAGEEGRLNLYLKETLSRSRTLYLLTKMDEPGENYFAWAKFRSFEILLDIPRG